MVDKIKKGSWKTTLCGACTFAIAILVGTLAYFDGDPVTEINPSEILQAGMALFVGLGLFAARDNDKSSEDVEAK